MADMLVKLYNVEDCPELEASLKEQGIYVVKALSPDKHKIIKFIKETFTEGWASECEAAFANNPHTIYIAVKDQQVIGFAAYDATAKGYFGPTGVNADFRKKGIGRLLMLKCFHSMRELGYGYAIIGWAARSAIPFYEKFAGAKIIEDSHPGVYSRMTKVVSPAPKVEQAPACENTQPAADSGKN